MRRPLLFAACFLVIGSLGSTVFGGVYIPPGVSVGDQYRLVFVTVGSTDALSDDAQDYDTFVNNQVLGTDLDLTGTGYNWHAIVSTASSVAGEARSVNTMVPFTDTAFVAVYNTNGDVVKGRAMDMLSGGLDVAIRYDQNGEGLGRSYVWTGTNRHGLPANQVGQGSDFRVGSPTGATAAGISNEVTDWLGTFDPDHGSHSTRSLNQGTPASPQFAHVYAISDVITAVPEPTTFIVWCTLSGVAGLVFWRRRRNA